MNSDPSYQSNPLEDTATYTMLMHLSQFAAYVVPFIGWCAPIIMWAIKREQAIVDQHGKIIFNWMLSAIIYSVGLLVLTMLVPFLTIPLLVLLALASIVFIILAAVNAKNGQANQYPLAIPFFK